MLANDTTPVSMAVFVSQQIQVHCVNAAIWSTRALIVNEVNNSLNQTIFAAITCNSFPFAEETFRHRPSGEKWASIMGP